MKRLLGAAILAIVLVGLSGAAHAQHSYTFGIGGKFGNPFFGITGKYFMGNQSALEGIFSFGGFGAGLTGLYEFHMHIPEAPGLRWYFGGGGHIASNRSGYYNPYNERYYAPLQAGVDGVLGLEYIFAKMPLSVSVDVVPLLNLVGNVGVWWNAGFSLRYTLR